MKTSSMRIESSEGSSNHDDRALTYWPAGQEPNNVSYFVASITDARSLNAFAERSAEVSGG